MNKAIKDLKPGERFILDGNGTVYLCKRIHVGGPGEGTRVVYVLPHKQWEVSFNRPSLTYVEIVEA